MRTCGSELVREGAGTSAEDVSSEIKPSRTSSLPQIPTASLLSRTSETSPGSLPQVETELAHQ
ncbi:hypothetical protein EIZ61_08360 [Pseudomonas syringae]|nr:hypothetical protein EIZ61_08360 [Pseudomonas syringae]